MNRWITPLFLLASIVRADIAPDPLGSGMTPQPRGAEVPVALASEVVDLVLSKDRLSVKATFQMENLGAETAFEVGFPTSYDDDLKDFAVEAGGRKLAASLAEKQTNYGHKTVTDYWLVWPMKFAAGEKMTVVVTYWVEPNEDYFDIRGGSSSGWDVRFGGEEALERMNRRSSGYILKTGAPWKGPIGSAVVKLTLEDGLTSAHLRDLSPAPASREAARVVWKFESFEPAEDIAFGFNPSLTFDAEIKAVEAALANPDEDFDPREDDLQFLTHLVDLHAQRGDAAGMLATCGRLADLAIGGHAEEMTVSSDTADILLECAEKLIAGIPSLPDPKLAEACVARIAAFLEKWIPFVRGESDWEVKYALPPARLALALCYRHAGRDTRDLLRSLDRPWVLAGTPELAPESEGAATLEEERVTIAVGETGTEFDATLRILGKRDGEIALLRNELDAIEARLVGLSDGFFDGLEMTVNGTPLAAGCVEIRVKDEFSEGGLRTERYFGWKVSMKSGAAVEIRLRSTFPEQSTGPAWLWNPDEALPVDERGMDRVFADYTFQGRSWKGPRKVAVVARFPKDLPTANLRHAIPAGARVSEGEVRWDLPAVDTSAADLELSAMIRRFTLAQEIEYLEKVVKSQPKCADIARLQLARAYGAAGRADDQIRLLQALVDVGAKPLQIGGGGTICLEPGMYTRRPTEFYLLEALLGAGKEEEAKKLAPRAVAAMREEMEHYGPLAEEQVLEWEDLRVCFRLLGDEKGMKEAEGKIEELRKQLE
ncbi:MAG: hypothetical protein HYY18_11150 [Planctomycetes bacterium]|nr:hypothetical protein [Planctomycetota bacterium]